MSSPNQRTLRIHKNPIHPGDTFLQINDLDLYDAMRNLNNAGLVLYLYLAKNQDGFKIDLSKKEVVDNLKIMSKDSYYRGFKELEDKGFIIDNSFYCRRPAYQQYLDDMKKDTPKPGDF